MHQTSTYGYDEFNRLTSRTTLPANTADYTYNYDRWGNRWNQTVLDAGYNMSLTFNTANNQVSSYTYDAAGNLYNDGNHIYTYDAEGNLTKVDGGSTASYVYDALNHRVSTTVAQSGTTTVTEFVFNQNGQRVSEWNGTTRTVLKGHYYWGAKPVAYYDTTEVHFEHQDWQGTERMRTSYSGTVESSISTLPFGDGYSVTGTASTDPYGFAMLDYDSEDSTDHAQFRQYSSAQGRWLSPDPYMGSYDFSTPQSMNRYAYALNNPLSYIDPSGLEECTTDDDGNVSCDDDGSDNNLYYLTADGGLVIAPCTGEPNSTCVDANGNTWTTDSNGLAKTQVTITINAIDPNSCNMSDLACQIATSFYANNIAVGPLVPNTKICNGNCHISTIRYLHGTIPDQTPSCSALNQGGVDLATGGLVYGAFGLIPSPGSPVLIFFGMVGGATGGGMQVAAGHGIGCK